MRHALPRLRVLSLALVVVTACSSQPPAARDCALDGTCAPPPVGEYLACIADAECPSGMCGRDGICVGTQGCFVTAECPIDMYCNIALPLPLCAPLGPGACREDSQCAAGVCSGVNGGLGSCLECLEHADCASGSCNIDGTCAAQGAVEPPLTCPEHAHVQGEACVCDEGWTLDASNAGCVEVPPPTTTPEPTATDDTCALGGLYGDGSCDPGCPQPDPDCEEETASDPCAEYDYYGDGVCDDFCAEPDPDCEVSGGGDPCAERGYYGDGTCDEFCAEPDPDCDEEPLREGDPCGDVTYYGQCDGNSVVYCWQGAIDIVACTGNKPYCGLVSVQTGYDCVASLD